MKNHREIAVILTLQPVGSQEKGPALEYERKK
jgi:hypothetical protein